MWREFELARWDGDPPGCPRCGATGRCRLLPSAPGARRVWRCGACRDQFSVLAGTLLERSRASLAVWAAVVSDVAAGPVGARELARRHAITPETARLLRGRVTAAGVRPGADPAAALRALLRLPADEVARVRRAVPARRQPVHGPTRDYA